MRDAATLAADILERMRHDQTEDAAELMIGYRERSYFRRILVEKLAEIPSGEHWSEDPSYVMTGADLRALCEAAGGATAKTTLKTLGG